MKHAIVAGEFEPAHGPVARAEARRVIEFDLET